VSCEYRNLTRTRNDREQPKRPVAETPATVGFRPVFPGQRAPQNWVVLGLATRRSRVQIPPPLLKALVSDLLTRASAVHKRSSPGFRPLLPPSLPGLSSAPMTFGFLGMSCSMVVAASRESAVHQSVGEVTMGPPSPSVQDSARGGRRRARTAIAQDHNLWNVFMSH
jgi:hypothetical protein